MKRIAIAAGLALGLAWAGAASAAITGPVTTQSGPLEGIPGKDPAVTAFLGVPYAAPPVGDLRWKAPAPPLAWQGVRKADHFGDDCAQPVRQMPKDHGVSEDCLNLNLWTAATSSKDRRPVMLWMHGGSATGSASSGQVDGEALAKKGVVLITVNFRLGVLSGLAAPDLDKESGHNASGNYGDMDVIAALKWVHANITAFGGDPRNVTLFGQSAGAALVDYVSISPLAKGLFQRTIAESHVRYYKDPELFALPTQWTTKAAAEEDGVKFEQATGAKSLAEMRQLPWEKILATAKSLDLDVVLAGDHLHVIDGYVHPYDNGTTFKKGLQNNVFYMAGDNKDESGAQPDTAFDIITSGAKKATVNYVAATKLSDYVGHARDKFGKFADAYLKLYPATSDREAFLQSSAATRDSARVSTWMWASLWKTHATHPVYIYMWTHGPPGPNHDLSGASHGSEIPYIYGHPNAQWTDDDRRISDTMMSYWVNYATTGDPNGPGLAKWPAFSAKSGQIMQLGDQFKAEPLTSKAKIAFWKSFFAAQTGKRPPKSAIQGRRERDE